jgi:hypothetical protein
LVVTVQLGVDDKPLDSPCRRRLARETGTVAVSADDDVEPSPLTSPADATLAPKCAWSASPTSDQAGLQPGRSDPR